MIDLVVFFFPLHFAQQAYLHRSDSCVSKSEAGRAACLVNITALMLLLRKPCSLVSKGAEGGKAAGHSHQVVGAGGDTPVKS